MEVKYLLECLIFQLFFYCILKINKVFTQILRIYRPIFEHLTTLLQHFVIGKDHWAVTTFR